MVYLQINVVSFQSCLVMPTNCDTVSLTLFDLPRFGHYCPMVELDVLSVQTFLKMLKFG